MPGYHGDGGGLYLQISPAGTKSWMFRFTLAGRSREMGLGPLHTITLERARFKARDCRELLLDGIDPIEARRSSQRTAASNAAHAVTFAAEAEAYIEAHRSGWKNAKHAAQWTSTLETYAYPFIGKQLVSAIDTALVMKCLQPIWTSKTETASRVRGRIESVLDYAGTLNHRTGNNPARWKGHLDNLLPKPTAVAKTEHHAALPHAEVGAFMRQLRLEHGLAAKALELTILTATRTSEATGAQWKEFDFDEGMWTIPGSRMKAKKPHRVPLSKPAAKLFACLERGQSEFVFPGLKEGKPLSNMAMLVLLQKRMGRPDLTVHGFRSTFREWSAEVSNYPHELAEMALAHTIEDPTEAAYRRGDMLIKRAKMMQAWADYCGRDTSAKVTSIRRSKSANSGFGKTIERTRTSSAAATRACRT